MLFCLKLDFLCFFFALFELIVTQDDTKLFLLAAYTARIANKYLKFLLFFGGVATCTYMFKLQTISVIIGSEVLFYDRRIRWKTNKK